GGGEAEHVLRCRGALVKGVGPVLDADVGVETGMEGGGRVTRGEDVGGAGAQVGVDDHAVVDRETGRDRELDAGRRPDADDGEVGRATGPVGEADLFDVVAAVQRRDAGAEVKVDAVIGVQVPVDAADFGAEHPLEGNGAGVDHGDVAAELAGGGSDLGADPAGTDHDDVVRVVQLGGEVVGVGEAAQVVHAVEVAARHVESAGVAPVVSNSRS